MYIFIGVGATEAIGSLISGILRKRTIESAMKSNLSAGSSWPLSILSSKHSETNSLIRYKTSLNVSISLSSSLFASMTSPPTLYGTMKPLNTG